MKVDTISISSDDEVPLRSYVTRNGFETNGLTVQSIQQCEFCDEVFLNRYTAFVHNAKHIIIPLLKQDIYRCMECLYCFTSQKELEHHKISKHKQEIREIYDNEDVKIKSERLFAICDIVKSELDVKLEEYLAENIAPVKVKQELETKETHTSNLDVIVDELESHLVDAKVKISSRLRFEEDSDVDSELANEEDGGSGDQTVCKVDLNVFDERVGENKAIELGEERRNTKVEKAINVEYSSSIHYDELMKPGMYRCRKCTDRFPTRFQLIQHDTTHLRMRKPRSVLCIHCERFVATNSWQLGQHVQRHHPTSTARRPISLPFCKQCGLKYYSHERHMQIYHSQTYCDMCKAGFGTEEEKAAHMTEHFTMTKCPQCSMVSTAIEIKEHQSLCHRVMNISMVKLCEVCVMFLKNTPRLKYVFVKSVSEEGTRMECDGCGKQFFELKLVRRLHKRKERAQERERKKGLSNSERLKNIQQRLKMINKLSKCLLLFYLLNLA